jgi:hypothetical protein
LQLLLGLLELLRRYSGITVNYLRITVNYLWITVSYHELLWIAWITVNYLELLGFHHIFLLGYNFFTGATWYYYWVLWSLCFLTVNSFWITLNYSELLWNYSELLELLWITFNYCITWQQLKEILTLELLCWAISKHSRCINTFPASQKHDVSILYYSTHIYEISRDFRNLK